MDILTLAREIGAAIQISEEYITYRMHEQAVECDGELQKVIEKFNLKKAEIGAEISKTDSDKEKLDNLNTEIGELYKTIMDNENMKKFNVSKQEFDGILNKISHIITESARGADPYKIEADDLTGCGGSCETCGGCH